MTPSPGSGKSDALVAEVRKAAAGIAAASAGGLRIVGIGMACGDKAHSGPIAITIEALDDALLPARQLIEANGVRQFIGLLRLVGAASARRARLRDKLKEADGVAFVDDLVEAALRHAGSAPGAVIAALRDQPSGVVTINAANAPVIKAWMVDGRLRCSFELDPQLRWTSTRLVVRLPLFAVARISLVGKSVSAIAEHPMLPVRIRIASCRLVDNENEFGLRLTRRIVLRKELEE